MRISKQRKKCRNVKICVLGYKKGIVQKHGKLFAERNLECFRIDYECDKRIGDEYALEYKHDDHAVF